MSTYQVRNVSGSTQCSYPDVPAMSNRPWLLNTAAAGVNFAVFGTHATFDYIVVID